MKKTNRDCFFSIELKSKEYLKTVQLSNGNGRSVVVEGTIGEFQHSGFDDHVVLEVVGTKGTLKIDLSPEQINK